ncbi:blue-light-activated protein [Mariprofundus micogutta]|uniref:histidine kinase n=1 Tax=Mariprofundus micogutta TaxID=1921010 RepID=A0A1L8CNN9_9PROT|nr:PAS domain S-box protein [Mariprofundus micogutta]GAV20542.1 blue-light-activated protein [Mariprofundus micogutta]
MVNDSQQRVQKLLNTIDSLSASGVSEQVRELLELNQKLQSEIIEREKAESELLKLSQAVEHAGDAVLITDRNANIEYVNPAFTLVTGYKAEEVIGKNPRILKSTAQDESVYTDLWQTISNGKTWRGSMIERRKNGTFYPANISIAPIKNHNGEITHFVSIQHDASERQELEERMRESQKMEALGVLVGGIAHDFNNMLTGLTGNLFIARRKLKDNEAASDSIANAEQITKTASEMVKQLLKFARKDVIQVHPFEFKPFIRQAIQLAEISIPDDIQVLFKICDDELIVQADTTQLQQIIMNLFNNARDALIEKSDAQKTISLTVSSYKPDSAFKQRFTCLTSDKMVHLTVADNGCGIPAEHINKVTEPFFTTKGVGKGTGLGLSMVYSSIRSLGGILDITSTVGEGTVFHIYLPTIKSDALYNHSENDNHISYGKGESILIVDDDPVVRMSGRSVLESLGYKVFEASDGFEAVQTFNRHQHDIDLVILDLIMPRLGGVQAAERMREINPALPTIFVTSYEQKSLQQHQPKPGSVTLSKPYSIHNLSQTLRSQLQN